MRLASFSTTIDSPISANARTLPTRKSLFAGLLEALHHSRRLQAQRVLAQYRHLTVRHQSVDSASNAGGETDVGQ